MINTLLACPSPRDIELCQKAFDSITGVDKLIVKYYYKPKAMQIISDFFHAHKEYTHLAIKPDDLVSNKEHYDKLVSDLQEHDYPILGGLCNANVLRGVYKLGICENQVPAIKRENRVFRKVDVRDLPDVIARQGGKTIIKVAFAGIPFMFIRRDILEQVTLESDAKYNNIKEGTPEYDRSGSYDVVFCNKLQALKIPIYVDTTVKMLHLKHSPEAEKKLVGLKEPYVKFISKTGEEKYIVPPTMCVTSSSHS